MSRRVAGPRNAMVQEGMDRFWALVAERGPARAPSFAALRDLDLAWNCEPGQDYIRSIMRANGYLTPAERRAAMATLRQGGLAPKDQPEAAASPQETSLSPQFEQALAQAVADTVTAEPTEIVDLYRQAAAQIEAIVQTLNQNFSAEAWREAATTDAAVNALWHMKNAVYRLESPPLDPDPNAPPRRSGLGSVPGTKEN